MYDVQCTTAAWYYAQCPMPKSPVNFIRLTWVGVGEIVRDYKLIRHAEEESNKERKKHNAKTKTLKVSQIQKFIYVVCLSIVTWWGDTRVMLLMSVSNYLVFPSDCKRRHRIISFIYIYLLVVRLYWMVHTHTYTQNGKSLIYSGVLCVCASNMSVAPFGSAPKKKEEIYVWGLLTFVCVCSRQW